MAGGVLQVLDPPDDEGRTLHLTIDLQADFALNQPLSPFALAALELLDREAPDYALDVVSRHRGDVEDPGPSSAPAGPRQGEAIAQMKAEGIEYEERMELLEEVEHPQPLREELDAAYETYRRATRGWPTTSCVPSRSSGRWPSAP